jgi:hypothetical protein
MNVTALVTELLKETWSLTMEMAPYLLLGFLVAGLLRAFFNEDWVKRHLGQAGLYQIFKAVVIGIPLPLCSCGVIPVAAAIRRQGGQPGAVAAFTTATPQTGVDAIAASVGLLGWPFTVVRVILAFINGIVSGLLVERIGAPTTSKTSPDCCSQTGGDSQDCCSENKPNQCCSSEDSNGDCCSSENQTAASCCSGGESGAAVSPPGALQRLRRGLFFGLYTLPRDLFTPLIVGLFLAGVISTFVPANLFSAMPGGIFGSYLAMTLVSLPLYVCSTGSIPMAFSFLTAGLSPGAVLIFLMAGPATNTATVSALWSMIGSRATIGYILSIVVTAWLAAFLLDTSGLSLLVAEQMPHHHTEASLFPIISGSLLLAILAISRIPKGKWSATV